MSFNSFFAFCKTNILIRANRYKLNFKKLQSNTVTEAHLLDLNSLSNSPLDEECCGLFLNKSGELKIVLYNKITFHTYFEQMKKDSYYLIGFLTYKYSQGLVYKMKARIGEDRFPTKTPINLNAIRNSQTNINMSINVD